MLPPPAARGLSDVVSDLESGDDDKTTGPELIREWLRCVSVTPFDADDFVGTMPAVEHAMRAADGAGLARELVDRCIAVVNATQSDLCDPSAKARALIVGLAWLLRKRRELTLASKVVHEAVEVATEAGDHSTAALGYACLGHIHRELAEETPERQRAKHLRIAEESVVRSGRAAHENGGSERSPGGLLPRSGARPLGQVPAPR